MPFDQRSGGKVSLRELRGRVQFRPLARRVLGYARPHRKILGVGLLALAVGSGINLLFPYLIRQFIEGKLGVQLIENLGVVTAILVGLFFVQAVVFYIRHYCFSVAGYRVVTDIRNQLYESMVFQDVQFFDGHRVGDLLSRLSADAQMLQRAVTINISVALRYLLQVVGGLVLMMCISLRMTALIVLAVPLLALGSAVWGKKLRGLSRTMQEELGEAQVVAEETLSAIRTAKIFTEPRSESIRYDVALTKALRSGELRTHIAALFSSTMVFLVHSAIVICVSYGASLVASGSLSIGDLTAFLLYCVIVAVSFGFLVGVWDEFLQAVGASERIFEVIDQHPTIVSPEAPLSPPTDARYGAELRAVSFRYPARPDVEVLSDISLTIPPGRTVALVGPSGSGKSTIASLLPRLYDCAAGEILIASIPVRTWDLAELRSKISVVPQQPHVFSRSIFENIRYGRPSASDEEILQAARAANVDQFAERLPQRYDTLVGDKGVLLSGGERQRIAIARAILKDAPILILDEATSSLDSENEQLVQAALDRLRAGRTTLIIAHRLSTVKHADSVVVIKQGRILQRGTHTELMAQEGLYRTLVEHQLLG